MHDPKAAEVTAQTEDNDQDFHVQLRTILSSCLGIDNDDGMHWDMVWEGTMVHLHLVFFIMVFKVDGKEGDKLCLQYTSKGVGVKSLCRMCTCPADKSDEAYRDDPMKTQAMIQGLVESGNTERLKQLSQQCVENTLHSFRFGSQDGGGVHTATPPRAPSLDANRPPWLQQE